MLKRRGTLAWVAIVALLGAWMMTSPPFSAPDEAAHYLRALTLKQGHLTGPPAQNLAASGPAWQVRQTEWTNHDRRMVFVPAGWSPGDINCLAGQTSAAGCNEVTYTGNYFPLPYLLPAAAISTGSGVQNTIYLGRAGSLVEVAILLALALSLAAFGSGWVLLGVLGAATPTVLFIGASINPSGPTMAAGLALTAGLARWVAGERPMPRWAAWSTLGAAAFLMLAWQLGPAFLVLDLLTFAGLAGRERLRRAWNFEHDRLLTAGGVLTGCLVIFILYASITGAIHSSFSLSHLGSGISAAVHGYGKAIKGSIAVFGANDEWMSNLFYLCWLALIAALVVAALVRGPRRSRITVAASCGLAVAFPLVFDALFQFNTGFGLQGRYVQPVLALVPLTAATALEVHPMFARPLLQRRIHTLAIIAVGALQIWAWGVGARIAGGVRSTFTLLSNSHWHPPGGWLIWFILVLVAAASMLAAAVRGSEGRLRRTRLRARRQYT